MKKSGLISLAGISLITLILLGLTIGFNKSPLLGLDLQGGIEVVLRPTAGQEVNAEKLDLAAGVIRRRIDSLGVAEPDVTRQGNNVIIQLPGVNQQERAVELIGQTGKLEFRPVIFTGAITCREKVLDTTGLVIPGASINETTAAVTPDEIVALNLLFDSTIAEYDAGVENGDINPIVVPACEGVEPTEPEPVTGLPDLAELIPYIQYGERRELIITDPVFAESSDDAIYTGSDNNAKYLLGPSLLDGSALRGASAQLTGISTWSIQLNFHGGETGIDLFNDAARICGGRQAECPTSQLGIVLDGSVESAPTVQSTQFAPNEIFIQGAFSEKEAKNLALVLRFGALPLEFDDPVEAGLVRSVSATLGSDSLRAGIIAGIIGLSLVAIYMILYYRAIGLLALLSLALSALLLWTIVTFLSTTQGLALTLAGITGLIVSIGVSLDSNVVYFENLKEDLSNGKTLSSSADQAFPVAFKTIFWANLATLIGAGILWLLTIGSVRGFAAILILASILDLVATYFFLRPAVKMLAHSKLIARRPKLLVGVKGHATQVTENV